MTNKEKIAHLQSMHKQATEMIAHCKKQIADNPLEWSCKSSMPLFMQDAAALKFALKAIQLMQDLINDEGGQDGE